MDLNDCRYFVLIVDHGGYTAVERITGIQRSKLSRRIAQLEESLGVRLLQRTTRRQSMTEAGQVFYDHCKAMLIEAESAQEAVAQLRSEPAGLVRISCPTVMAQLYLAQLIGEFMTQFPKVRIELDATDRNVNLIEERFDIAVRTRSAALREPGLVAKQVASGRFILVASPKYLSTCKRLEQPADLDAAASIGALGGGQTQNWLLNDLIGNTVKSTLQPRLLCSDLGSQLQACLCGVGIALLPQRIVAEALADGRLKQVLAPWGTPDEGIHLLIASRRGMLPSVRALVDFLTDKLPGALGYSGG